MEMGYDSPEVPVGMLTDFHLKRCTSFFPLVHSLLEIGHSRNLLFNCAGEEILLYFVDKLKSSKETGKQEEASWADFSQRWFTLLPTTRPLSFKDFGELADHVNCIFIFCSQV